MGKLKYYSRYDGLPKVPIRKEDFEGVKIYDICEGCNNRVDNALYHYNKDLKGVYAYCETCENGGAYDIIDATDYDYWLKFIGAKRLNK
tara:strand:+ start:345 stop:611 length:267 start_codon:yes stop_codon:yes gene_type:complete